MELVEYKYDYARALGFVPTPKELVEFMVYLAFPEKNRCKVLEPACGNSPFLKTFAEFYGLNHEFVGMDINPEILQKSRESVPFANIIEEDFLLWNTREKFDIIIGNPPFGIIGDASHYNIHMLLDRKPLYKRKFKTWSGKFNIYGAFIEQAVNLLNTDGKLVFVVPASWLILKDFTKLRIFLSNSGKLSIYYLGRVFPRRNVSCVVIVFEKRGKGMELYDRTELAVKKPNWKGEIVRFETNKTTSFESMGIPLEHMFDIYFAARSPEFRSHPEVVTMPKKGYVPVLTGRNLKPDYIDYGNCYSGLWMPKEFAAELRFFYGFPHIVVGHTKGTRVVAALDDRCYPWREEFHIVPKAEGIDLRGIVNYLNSQPVQEYIWTLYRDFVPHLTLTMLRHIPIHRKLVKNVKIFTNLPLFGEKA